MPEQNNSTIKAEEIVRKLVLRDQDESQILHQLDKHNLADKGSVELVRRIILEHKTAKAFGPRHAPRKRIKSYGLLLIIMGVSLIAFFSSSNLDTSGRGGPAGYCIVLIIAGLVLFFKPDKGMEKW